MTGGADYEFEWDDAKAESNLATHGVDFMDAMSVLLDPLAMTRFDDEHSDDEERWISVGRRERAIIAGSAYVQRHRAQYGAGAFDFGAPGNAARA